MVTQKQGGLRDAVMYLGTSAHPCRGCITWLQECTGQPGCSCLPFVLVRDCRTVPSWAAVQGCLVVPAHLCASGSRAGSEKEGWEMPELLEAIVGLSQLLLAQVGERHDKSRVGESALHNHDVTPKVRAAVTSQREERGCWSTRKFSLCHHEGKHLHAAWPLECS